MTTPKQLSDNVVMPLGETPPRTYIHTSRVIVSLSWETVNLGVDILACCLRNARVDHIVGITRGGLVPAVMLSHRLGAKFFHVVTASSYSDDGRKLKKPSVIIPDDVRTYLNTVDIQRVLFVDDIVDSGETLKAVHDEYSAARFAVLMTKIPAKDILYFGTIPKDVWVKFPWENGL